MKKTILLLAAIFALQVNILVAGNEEHSRNSVDAAALKINMVLAPVTPLEATFEEIAEPVDTIRNLAPVNPAVADYEELN